VDVHLTPYFLSVFCSTRLSYCEYVILYKKGKAIAVAGHGGPKGCETSSLPHFFRRVTDGGEVICLVCLNVPYRNFRQVLLIKHIFKTPHSC
jgi:hypothetical protein